MNGGRSAIDGARRRRIYLFRHGAVDYVDAEGNVVADTRLVDLNERGREQARAMQQFFGSVSVDTAYCSDLKRTRQTGETILGERPVKLRTLEGLSEIAAAEGQTEVPADIVQDIAFLHWRAEDTDTRFLGGERYADFYARVTATMDSLTGDPAWQDLALFAHGGTNAAILGWVSGLQRAAFGVFDQATCCLNVIDIDSDASGQVIRKTIRATNITTYDPTKSKRHAADMELLAHRILREIGER